MADTPTFQVLDVAPRDSSELIVQVGASRAWRGRHSDKPFTASSRSAGLSTVARKRARTRKTSCHHMMRAQQQMDRTERVRRCRHKASLACEDALLSNGIGYELVTDRWEVRAWHTQSDAGGAAGAVFFVVLLEAFSGPSCDYFGRWWLRAIVANSCIVSGTPMMCQSC